MPLVRTHEPQALTATDRTDLIRRALTAWHAAGSAVPPAASKKPVAARVASKAGKVTGAGEESLLHFVVVHAGLVVLAVYRVRRVKDFWMLRRMLRPPKDLVRLKG